MNKLTLKTLADVERCLTELQRLTIERDLKTAALEKRQAAIAAEYGAVFAELDANIAVEQKALELYLKEHKSDFDGPPRSVQFVSGTIGYRLGMPRLKPVSRGSWEKVLQLLTDFPYNCYIRSTPEVDREALMADSDALGAEGLAKLGLRKVQDDSPFIEPARLPEPAQE
jgi:phage host-nuclease inhibitor protein Gam